MNTQSLRFGQTNVVLNTKESKGALYKFLCLSNNSLPPDLQIQTDSRGDKLTLRVNVPTGQDLSAQDDPEKNFIRNLVTFLQGFATQIQLTSKDRPDIIQEFGQPTKP
jgi:hypothetical protein